MEDIEDKSHNSGDKVSSNVQTKTQTSFLSGVLLEIRRREFINAAASLIAIVTALTAAFFFTVEFIQKTVEERVDRLMEPHQQMFSAVMSNQYDDAWSGINTLTDMLESCEKRIGSDAKIADLRKCLDKNTDLFVELYLWSISSSHDIDIGDFHSMAQKVLKIAGPNIISNGNQLTNAGWYYLRISNVKEALIYFDAAVLAYRSQNEFRPSAWAHWGRGAALMVSGMVEGAKHELAQAIRCAPSDFIWLVERGEEFAISADLHFRGLVASRPELEKTIRETVVEVRSLIEDPKTKFGQCQSETPRFYASESLSDRFANRP